MKQLTQLTLTLLISLAHTAPAQASTEAKCNAGDTTKHACISSPQPLDQQVAINQFQSIAFCEDKQNEKYVVTQDFSEESPAFGVKPIAWQYTNPSSFYRFAGQNLIYTMKIDKPLKVVNSTLSVYFTSEYTVTSSFICK